MTDEQKRLAEEVANDLKTFDFYYEYTDDHNEWRKWSHAHRALIEKLKKLPMYKVTELIMSHAPEGHAHKFMAELQLGVNFVEMETRKYLGGKNGAVGDGENSGD